MWPILRHKVLWACCKQIEGIKFDRNPALSARRNEQRKQHLAELTPQALNDKFARLRQNDVLIVSAARQTEIVDGHPVNRYIWPFEELLSISALVEEEPNSDVGDNRIWHEYIFDFARKSPPQHVCQEDQQAILGLLDWIKSTYGDWLDESAYQSYKNQLEVTATRLGYWKSCYQKIFAAVKPKLVIIGNASYGNRAFLIKWAKEFGARVAEFQHAAIHENLTPYQYSADTLQSDYVRDYLPDDFLMFGSYWQSVYHGGARPVIIGHPYFQYVYKKFHRTAQELLVCINGFDNDYCIRYLRDLISKFSAENIVIRFHPSVHQLQHQYKDILGENIRFSAPDTSLFDDMARASMVIAEASTVIYESLACGIPTFLIPTRQWPQLPGLGAADMVLSVENKITSQQPMQNSDQFQYFGEHWQSNLAAYLTSIGIKTR
ncbi:hypothetical protein [Neptunicella sp. SCSIO 80796]|uniref:hypothetical protein n=1 Tax=Neptunicella plasticusilytica TaxID=3117012 RepID=UPI003A4D7D0A